MKHRRGHCQATDEDEYDDDAGDGPSDPPPPPAPAAATATDTVASETSTPAPEASDDPYLCPEATSTSIAEATTASPLNSQALPAPIEAPPAAPSKPAVEVPAAPASCRSGCFDLMPCFWLV